MAKYQLLRSEEVDERRSPASKSTSETSRVAAPPRIGGIKSGQTPPSADDVLTSQHIVGNRATTNLVSARRLRPLPTTGYSIQRVLTPEEIIARGNAIAEMSKTAPTEGANLWKLYNETSKTTLYLLGTQHGNIFQYMLKARGLIQFLTDTQFDGVYSEIAEDGAKVTASELTSAIDTLHAPLPDESSATSVSKRDKAKRDVARNFLGGLGKLDGVYTTLASKGQQVIALETDETRAAIVGAYKAVGSHNANENHYAEPEKIEGMVANGNEQALMGMHSNFLKKGIDVQQIEARNQEWVEKTTGGEFHPGQTIIWVVGASHLGGLINELKEHLWTATTVALAGDKSPIPVPTIEEKGPPINLGL